MFEFLKRKKAGTNENTAGNDRKSGTAASGREQCPDVTRHKKLICIYGVSRLQAEEKMQEYFEICTDSRKEHYSVKTQTLAMNSRWLCMELIADTSIGSNELFQEYENILLWLSDLSQRLFLLAIPRANDEILFSTVDTQNPAGDSCRGVYASREYYFSVPEEKLEWFAPKEGQFDYFGFIQYTFGFEVEWLNGLQ